LEDVNLKGLEFVNAGPYIPMTKEPIRTMEDFEGKKLRTLSGPPTEAMKLLGAAPLYVPAPEIYLSVEKGVIDGVNFPWVGISIFGLGEVIQYYTEVGISYNTSLLAMNLDTWNSLPSDIQGAAMSVFGLEGSQWIGNYRYDYLKELDIALLDTLAAEGYPQYEIIQVPKEETDRWVAAVKPVWDEWVQSFEPEMRPVAQSVMEEYVRLIQEYPPLKEFPVIEEFP